MKMNCLILEEDRTSREMLRDLCSRIAGLDVRIAETPTNAITDLEEELYDLVFLNIEVPNIGGLNLMKSQEKMPPVIITSTKKKCKENAFNFEVIDHLKKPVSMSRLIKAIRKARKRCTSKDGVRATASSDHMLIKADGVYIRLLLRDVITIASLRDYVIFQLENDRFVVHSTLKSIHEKLKSDKRFFKVHRSYIVNVNHIVEIDDRSVVVGKQIIPVSRSKRQEFEEYLNML